MSETQYVTFNFVDQIFVFVFFVNGFGRSLRGCHLEFDKEANLMVEGVKIPRYPWGILNLKEFKRAELLSSLTLLLYFLSIYPFHDTHVHILGC